MCRYARTVFKHIYRFELSSARVVNATPTNKSQHGTSQRLYYSHHICYVKALSFHHPPFSRFKILWERPYWTTGRPQASSDRRATAWVCRSICCKLGCSLRTSPSLVSGPLNHTASNSLMVPWDPPPTPLRAVHWQEITQPHIVVWIPFEEQICPRACDIISSGRVTKRVTVLLLSSVVRGFSISPLWGRLVSLPSLPRDYFLHLTSFTFTYLSKLYPLASPDIWLTADFRTVIFTAQTGCI